MIDNGSMYKILKKDDLWIPEESKGRLFEDIPCKASTYSTRVIFPVLKK
jgi:hypothetical protein